MRKGEATRQAILDHAVGVASREGLEGLTIGRLAEELGLSKSGLFAHFQSKEALQVQTLERAGEHFIEAVVRPALRAARGEPRLRALFERWLEWPSVVAQRAGGGCIFVAAASELDDCPGAVRDRLVQLQKDWLDMLAEAARIARDEGHLRADLDLAQFAFELYGVMLAAHHATRLLGDAQGHAKAQRAFERLIFTTRPSKH